jgi:hypothetical protein
MMLEIQVMSWDRHNNVNELNQLMWSSFKEHRQSLLDIGDP